MFNQSGRPFDQGQDCKYLMGINPDTNRSTDALLGPYLKVRTVLHC